MPEDSWLRIEREYFSETFCAELDIPEKKLNKILEKYNKFLQDALLGESPYVAEDLRLTMIKSRGELGKEEQN